MLYREGFTELAYAGIHVDLSDGGVGATEEKIKKEPAEVFAFVRPA